MSNFIPFAKMNGIGNQILVADMRARNDHITKEAAIALAQNPQTCFDQIMAIHKPPQGGALDGVIEILNADGSLAEACGNGTRCVVAWLAQEHQKSDYHFTVLGKPLHAHLHNDGMISVNMGKPHFSWDAIPLSEEFADTRRIELQVGPIDAPILHTPSVANIGNPHVVFWTEKNVNSYALDKFGPMLEHHPLFPERVNISLARIIDKNTIEMRTWERGAGLTLACGSAACAVAVCAARLEKAERQTTLHLPGGPLHITWRDDGHIIMRGAAEHEWDGFLNPITGAFEYQDSGKP